MEMANNQLTLIEHMIREELKLPISDLVLNQIIEISREIPDNVNNLQKSYAQHLAGRFLKGMDLCAELYAVGIAFELKRDVVKKREYGLALLNRSKNQGLKTAKEKEAYANIDELYIESCNQFAEARAFRIRVEMLRKDFEKAHYLMRKISEGDTSIKDTDNPDIESNSYNSEEEKDNDNDGWSNIKRQRKAWS